MYICLFVCDHLSSPLDKSQRAEVDQMLRTMLEAGENNSIQNKSQIALVAHCLAMLWFLGGDPQKVRHLTELPDTAASVWHRDTFTHFPTRVLSLEPSLERGFVLIGKALKTKWDLAECLDTLTPYLDCQTLWWERCSLSGGYCSVWTTIQQPVWEEWTHFLDTCMPT